MGNKDNNEPSTGENNEPQEDTSLKEVRRANIYTKHVRIKLIGWLCFGCFIFLVLILFAVCADLQWWGGKFYDKSIIVVFVSIMSTTLTTLVGVVIGSSSID